MKRNKKIVGTVLFICVSVIICLFACTTTLAQEKEFTATFSIHTCALEDRSMSIGMKMFADAQPIGDPTSKDWEQPCGNIKIISVPDEFFHPEEYLQSKDVIIISVGSEKRLSRCTHIPVENHRFHLPESVCRETVDSLNTCQASVRYPFHI